MRHEIITALSQTPPPKSTFKYSNIKEAQKVICELESSLGLPASQPIFSIGRINARVIELENMAAITRRASIPSTAESVPAAASVAPPPALPASFAPPAFADPPVAFYNLKNAVAMTVDKFLGMPIEARERFASDGGEMNTDVFNSLPLHARENFNARGGKLVLTGSKEVRHFTPDPIQENRSRISLSVFNAMSKTSQALILKHGGRVVG